MDITNVFMRNTVTLVFYHYFHLIRFKFEFEFYLFIYGNNMRVIYVLCNQSDISNGELVRQKETNLKREKCTRDSLTL